MALLRQALASSPGCKSVTGLPEKTEQKEGRQLLLNLWGTGPGVTLAQVVCSPAWWRGGCNPGTRVTAGQGQGKAIMDPGRTMSGSVQPEGEKGEQPYIPKETGPADSIRTQRDLSPAHGNEAPAWTAK